MATIVNNPPVANTSNDSSSFLLFAIILFVVMMLLFFVYGLPLLRQSASVPQINVPGKIDVNVQSK